MSETQSILSRVKSERLEREALDRCLAELRRPWYAPFGILAAQVPWIYLAIGSFDDPRDRSVWFYVVGIVVSLIGVVFHIRQRDQMWRDLIRKKCPELLHDLSKD